jgi:diaminohydroxyphosphoribosylaminopyrimidine deaminase/5-amino-6-(5-phosphoribosylamino)uracil reductase
MVQREGRPWVIAKTAMSLDGRITRPPGEGQWLTGTAAREEVQRLRTTVEAIVTSGETVRKDDPALTVRSKAMPKEREQPWRVVITRKELDRSRYQIFLDRWRERSLVFRNRSKYDILRTMSSGYGVTTVLLEAGGSLLGEFQDRDLIDEWVIYLAPLVCGGPAVALGGEGTPALEKRFSLKEVTIRQVGRDVCARGVVDRKGPQPLER